MYPDKYLCVISWKHHHQQRIKLLVAKGKTIPTEDQTITDGFHDVVLKIGIWE